MQFKAVAPNVFVWLDTCNVYVIKDGASAILIDIGDGLVLDALSQNPRASKTCWSRRGQPWREDCRAGK